MRPVRHRSQCRAGREQVRFCKHCHQSYEATITAPIKPDSFWIDAMLLHEVVHSIDMITKIFSTHVTIDSGSPVSPVTGTATVINVQHEESTFHQQVIKHVLAIVVTPPTMHVLQITRAMNEENGRATTFPRRRHVHSAVDGCPITRFETDDTRIDPIVREKFRNR